MLSAQICCNKTLLSLCLCLQSICVEMSVRSSRVLHHSPTPESSTSSPDASGNKLQYTLICEDDLGSGFLLLTDLWDRACELRAAGRSVPPFTVFNCAVVVLMCRQVVYFSVMWLIQFLVGRSSAVPSHQLWPNIQLFLQPWCYETWRLGLWHSSVVVFVCCVFWWCLFHWGRNTEDDGSLFDPSRYRCEHFKL